MQIKNQQITIIISILILILGGGFCVKSLDHDYTNTAFALEAPNYDKIDNLDDVILAHHEYMNKFFNEKMKLLKTTTASKDFDENGQLKCTDQSVATYCVAQEGDKELESYLRAINKKGGTIKQTDDTASIQSYLFELTDKNESAVTSEMTSSVNAFELALDLYDQYQKNYALHTEYQKIIKSLEKYRDEMIKIRNPSEYMPSEFENVTTNKCT